MSFPSYVFNAAFYLILRKLAKPGITLTTLVLAACVPTGAGPVSLAADARIAQAQADAAGETSREVHAKPMQYAGLAENDDAPFQQGRASFYRHGSRTANGERFDPSGMTAAHPSLPFGTQVRVVDPATGNAVVVRINDRGPFTGGRVIDLAEGAARKLGIIRAGVAPVALYRLD